jgi:hypothetical protein
MALDVKVTINLMEPTGKSGTWYPLIYVIGSGDELKGYKEYSTLSDVLEDYEAATDAYKAANLIFMQDNAPTKIAILEGAADVVNGLADYMTKSWRQLIVLKDFDAALSTYIESTDKMYFTHFADKAALSAVNETIKQYDNTFAVVYNDTSTDPVKYPEAGVVGATAGLKAGSFTYKNMVIKGVSALDISDSDLTDIHKAGGITIVEKAGDIVTSEGIVASCEYADVIDSKDYIIQNITYKTQKLFNNNAKIPYTNNGIAMLEAATLEALVDGYNNGMIADNDDGSPAYTVSFVLRSQTTETDRANRDYPYGQFSFVLSGAIHTAEIVGEINV